MDEQEWLASLESKCFCGLQSRPCDGVIGGGCCDQMRQREDGAVDNIYETPELLGVPA